MVPVKGRLWQTSPVIFDDPDFKRKSWVSQWMIQRRHENPIGFKFLNVKQSWKPLNLLNTAPQLKDSFQQLKLNETNTPMIWVSAPHFWEQKDGTNRFFSRKTLLRVSCRVAGGKGGRQAYSQPQPAPAPASSFSRRFCDRCAAEWSSRSSTSPGASCDGQARESYCREEIENEEISEISEISSEASGGCHNGDGPFGLQLVGLRFVLGISLFEYDLTNVFVFS